MADVGSVLERDEQVRHRQACAEVRECHAPHREQLRYQDTRPSGRGPRTTTSSTLQYNARMANADRIAEFKEVAELMPEDPVVRFGLAGAYLDAGESENAIHEYRETIRLKPDYSAAHRGLGRALEQAGRIADAIAAYRQGIEVATRNGDLQTVKEMQVFLRRLEKAAG